MIEKAKYRFNDTFRDKRVIAKIEKIADDEFSKSSNSQAPFLSAKEKDELFDIIANDKDFENYIREIVKAFFC